MWPSMKRSIETFSWRMNLKLNASRCFSWTHATVRFFQRNKSDKRFPREVCFDQGDVKVEKHIVTFNEETDEDVLLEDGPQIERGTVYHRDTCQFDIYRRNNRDKHLPREACFDQGDFKVEKKFKPSMKRRMKTLPWRRCTVFLRDTCHCETCQRNIRDKRTLVVVILFFLCKPYVTITQ